MAKKFFIFSILTVFCMLFITSCGKDKSRGLLDFDKYKDVNVNSIEKIKVEWDVNDSSPIEFVISEGEKIDVIIDRLCDNAAFVLKDGKNDSGHSRITLIDTNNNQTAISLAYITDGDDVYYYSDTSIYDLVYNEGKTQGVLS